MMLNWRIEIRGSNKLRLHTSQRQNDSMPELARDNPSISIIPIHQSHFTIPAPTRSTAQLTTSLSSTMNFQATVSMFIFCLQVYWRRRRRNSDLEQHRNQGRRSSASSVLIFLDGDSQKSFSFLAFPCPLSFPETGVGFLVVRDLRGEGVAEPLFGPMLKVTALSVLTSRLRLYLSRFSLMAFGVGLSSPADGFGVKCVMRVERG